VRSVIDAGVRVSFASDHPCGRYAPAEIMWSAVARQDFSGAPVDPSEAATPRLPGFGTAELVGVAGARYEAADHVRLVGAAAIGSGDR
jgi:predicted amidohydrolase YtcJ